MRRNQLLILGATLIMFLSAFFAAQSAQAQEPICPPGFAWQRMSGVGCVQNNCLEIANAKYSYTQACICLDGYKGCYQQVDYSGFDQSQCGPNCPVSELTSCVAPDAACPNESPAVDLTAAPEITIAPTQQSPTFIENTPSPPGEESDFNDFIAILEEMVTGGNTSPASNGQEAAGGMAATTLLTAWILINLLTSGGSIQDILADLLGLGTRHPPSGSQAQAQMSPPPNLSTSGHTGSQPAPGQSASSVATVLNHPPNKPAPAATVLNPPAGKPADSGATQKTPSPILTDPTKFQQAIQDKYQDILKDKVKENYYVRNPDFIHKVWNNFPIFSSVYDSLADLKGGQCGEFANWGQQWITPWAEQTFGPGVIVDQIWIGESSSRYPEGLIGAADALIQANHTANRITLPNGDSYVVDFWDGMIKQRDGSPESIQNIQVVKESDWIIKWRDQIETTGDPADICNLNKFQESLRQHIASFDAKHPSMASAGSPERWQENNELVERAINDWMQTSNFPPEIKQTVVQNWRKNGGMWGIYRPDPPLDPASAVFDSYYQLTD